jgi:hypothetical protein
MEIQELKKRLNLAFLIKKILFHSNKKPQTLFSLEFVVFKPHYYRLLY